MPRWFHLTAVVHHAPDLSAMATGAWLWTHLRAAFPDAIAAVLMPDHPHIVVPADEPEAARLRLARLLGQLGRRLGIRGRVADTPAPAPIRERGVLARQVRYVALNPCRAGYVACPLAWRWSTHRDVLGASVDPWVTASRLAAALDDAPRGFAARHHAYVSGDPHARVAGTPLPVAAAPSMLSRYGLRDLAEAATAATRCSMQAIRGPGASRALFVALAYEQGWGHASRLAEICGCSRSTIHRLRDGVDAQALAAARLCLGDARLRRQCEEPSQIVAASGSLRRSAPLRRKTAA
jgi:hypothetical protein